MVYTHGHYASFLVRLRGCSVPKYLALLPSRARFVLRLGAFVAPSFRTTVSVSGAGRGNTCKNELPATFSEERKKKTGNKYFLSLHTSCLNWRKKKRKASDMVLSGCCFFLTLKGWLCCCGSLILPISVCVYGLSAFDPVNQKMKNVKGVLTR